MLTKPQWLSAGAPNYCCSIPQPPAKQQQQSAAFSFDYFLCIFKSQGLIWIAQFNPWRQIQWRYTLMYRSIIEIRFRLSLGLDLNCPVQFIKTNPMELHADVQRRNWDQILAWRTSTTISPPTPPRVTFLKDKKNQTTEQVMPVGQLNCKGWVKIKDKRRF